MIVAELSAGFTPMTWTASASPGSSVDWLGSSERAPVPRMSAKNGCSGAPVYRAPPSLVTWNHTAADADGLPRASHAPVANSATTRPHDHRAHQQGDDGAALRPTWSHDAACHLDPLLVVAVGAVVVVASSPPPDRATATLKAVTFHAPVGSGLSTRSPLRRIRSGAPFTAVTPWMSRSIDAVVEHDRPTLVGEADHLDRLRRHVEVAGDLRQALVDHHGAVRAGDAGERTGGEQRREVARRLGRTQRVDRGGGQVVADHLEDRLRLRRPRARAGGPALSADTSPSASATLVFGTFVVDAGAALPLSSPPPPHPAATRMIATSTLPPRPRRRRRFLRAGASESGRADRRGILPRPWRASG